MTPIIYLPSFEDDVLDIWLCVARENEAAADRLVDRIYTRCLMLRDHPGAGPLRPDIATDCRQLVAGPVLILYRWTDQSVDLVRAVYSGRDLNSDLFPAGS